MYLILGLFATRDYEANELVTLYLGRVLTADQSAEIEDRSYLLSINMHVTIDGKEGWEGIRGQGRWINSCPPGKKNNCRFFISHYNKSECGHVVKVKTTTKVKKGEEFWVSYGKSNK
jgi:hypothetical protein